ncbi:MAG: HU family DNA-binding protein [Deltaproteobacteria bacterium]|nr:HU family DNA-binding protein [Deltaproteobacteria bacterium]MCL5277475.1 HU family DNA-binding protein [Deltaproteobacteria bacterium]
MTKADLVRKLAEAAEVSKAKAELLVNSFLSTVTALLKKGDKLTLPGFGTFLVTKRAAREGINPRTKAKLKIPARRVPKFKAGSNLKKTVSK